MTLHERIVALEDRLEVLEEFIGVTTNEVREAKEKAPLDNGQPKKSAVHYLIGLDDEEGEVVYYGGAHAGGGSRWCGDMKRAKKFTSEKEALIASRVVKSPSKGKYGSPFVQAW